MNSDSKQVDCFYVPGNFNFRTVAVISTIMCIIFTLCAYAQQGYAFGRVRLYICMSTKKQAV